MLQLITLLLASLTIFAIGNIRQSNYGKIAFSISERWKAKKSIVNVLNWLSRNFDDIADEKIIPKIKTDLKSKSKQENAERRLEGMAILRMVRLLLGNSFNAMIELWNPEDDSKDRLLGKRHVAKLMKGRETDYNKGGISPFTMTQIAYGIGQIYTDRHGTTWNENDGITLDQIDLKAYSNGEANEATKKFVAELFEIAKQYNKPKDEKWLKKQSDEDDSEPTAETEQVGSEYTVDDYLSGDIKPSDMDTELIEQFREDEKVTGSKQGVLTRELKKRK